MTFLLITLACLVGSAIFSGFENGILAVRRARLDHALAQGSRTARLIDHFLRHPAALLGTILLGNNLCNSFAAVYYDEWLKGVFGPWMMTSTRMTLLISLGGSALLTVVLLVCSEITPKVWFRQAPLARVSLVVIPIHLFHLLSWPFVRLLAFVSNLINRIFTDTNKKSTIDIALIREDFRMMLLESEEAGVLDREVRSLLDNSLDYHRNHVRRVMRPASEVEALPADFTLARALAKARESGSSRFPVADPADPTRWIGIFSVYDAIYSVADTAWETERVLDYLRPIVSIQETDSINQVLTRSRSHKSPLLVVTDSTGQHIGIVTANDVVFPLFGELNA